MKIALVCPYDFAYPGGVAQHICSLERHLTEMGHEVKVIAPASKDVALFGDRFIPKREVVSLIPLKLREIWNRVSPQRSRI